MTNQALDSSDLRESVNEAVSSEPDTRRQLDDPLGTYFRLYECAREEIYRRHDFQERVFTATLAAIAVLIGLSDHNTMYIFLLPVVSSLAMTMYLYHLSSKSRAAAYCRVIEAVLERSYVFEIPLWETAAGTFAGARIRSRNFEGLWAIRTGILPAVYVGSLAWFAVQGPADLTQRVVVGLTALLSLTTVTAFIRSELKSGQWAYGSVHRR